MKYRPLVKYLGVIVLGLGWSWGSGCSSSSKNDDVDADDSRGGGMGGASVGMGGGTSNPSGGQATNSGEYSIESFEYEDNKPLGYHPLRDNRVGLVRVEEVAFAIGTDQSGSFWMDDPAAEQVQHEYPIAIGSGERLASAARANVDDDGHDELVLVGHSNTGLTVAVVDGGDNAILQQKREFRIEAPNLTLGLVRHLNADVDGDGRDEIVVATVDGSSNWVRIFDDATKDFVLLDELKSEQSLRDIRIASGNFDEDPSLELAVFQLGTEVNSVNLLIYDDHASNFSILQTYEAADLLPSSEDSEWTTSGILVAGNFDADALDELYLLSYHDRVGSSTEQILGRTIDEVAGEGVFGTGPVVGDFGPNFETTRTSPFQVLGADVNGDGVEELYVAERTAGDENMVWGLSAWAFPDDTQWTGAMSKSLVAGYDGRSSVCLTQVDGDGVLGETVVAAFKDGNSDAPVEVFRIGAEPGAGQDRREAKFELTFPDEAEVYNVTSSANDLPFIVGGDFDNDSFRLRYTGNHWLSLPSPRPVVVMAGAPVSSLVEQNADDTETAFGREASRGSAETHEIGSTSNATMSFDAGALTGFVGGLSGLLSFTLSENLERSFSNSKTEASLTTYGTSYVGASSENYIVFQGVLFDSYEYEVEGASQQDVIGHRMTIDVPVAVKTYKWTLEYYNDSLTDPALRIDEETFQHELGDPASYPNSVEQSQLLSDYPGWRTTPITVGQGEGTNSVSLNLEEETLTSETETITNSSQIGGSIAGLGYDETKVAFETSVYEYTVGSATNYSAAVGDISDPEDYKRYSYDFAMLVYNFEHPSGQKFQVINFGTSNLGPGYDEE